MVDYIGLLQNIMMLYNNNNNTIQQKAPFILLREYFEKREHILS